MFIFCTHSSWYSAFRTSVIPSFSERCFTNREIIASATKICFFSKLFAEIELADALSSSHPSHIGIVPAIVRTVLLIMAIAMDDGIMGITIRTAANLAETRAEADCKLPGKTGWGSRRSVLLIANSFKTKTKTPPTLCQTHSAGGVPVSSDLFFSRQGTVHKVTLSVLRSRENSMCSVEMFTGQHTPYTIPIITEQCNVYSLSGNTSRFSQRSIQEWDFCLILA